MRVDLAQELAALAMLFGGRREGRHVCERRSGGLRGLHGILAIGPFVATVTILAIVAIVAIVTYERGSVTYGASERAKEIMTSEQLRPFVGQMVTATLSNGTTISGRLHDKTSSFELASPYAIEYPSPQTNTAYTDNRFQAIDKAEEIVSLAPAE